jgi:hypothetical protein
MEIANPLPLLGKGMLLRIVELLLERSSRQARGFNGAGNFASLNHALMPA